MRSRQVCCVSRCDIVYPSIYPDARLCIVVMRNHCDHAPLCAKAGNQYIIVFTKPKNFAIRWRTPPPSSNGIFFRHGVENIPVLVVKKVNGKRNPPSPPQIAQAEISMSVAFPTHVWKMANICKHMIVWLFSHMCAFSQTYVLKLELHNRSFFLRRLVRPRKAP